jgi:hypothetical protein
MLAFRRSSSTRCATRSPLRRFAPGFRWLSCSDTSDTVDLGHGRQLLTRRSRRRTASNEPACELDPGRHGVSETPRLQTGCTASFVSECPQAHKRFTCTFARSLAGEGSNLQPPDPKSGVLPVELPAKVVSTLQRETGVNIRSARCDCRRDRRRNNGGARVCRCRSVPRGPVRPGSPPARRGSRPGRPDAPFWRA